MKAMTEKYIETCRKLGFKAECGFVKLHPGGAIGFTCGKPEEIRALADSVSRLGMKMSNGLKRYSAQ